MSDQPVQVVIQPDNWVFLKALLWGFILYAAGRWDGRRIEKEKRDDREAGL